MDQQNQMAPQAPQNKLFFGNLPYSIRDAQLEDLCAPFGTVESANVVLKPGTTLSQGIGFVVMSSKAECDAVIAGLNEKAVDGRNIHVDFAKPKSASSGPRKTFGGGGSRGGFDRNSAPRRNDSRW